MIRILLVIMCCSQIWSLWADCNPYLEKHHSNRVANYNMEVQLDNESKCLDASTKLTWINHSPVPVTELRFYMYQNSFKNTESTFMITAEGNIFGDDPGQKKEEEWGWIEILSAKRGEIELIENAKYIQPDDDNLKDESVLMIPLDRPLAAGDTLFLDLLWSEKIPKIFARSGYEREDFYNMVHWFPQVGVWEQDRDGVWGWNCHQFHRRTEFYADFGVYDVSLTVPEHLVLGASGCEISNVDNGNGTKTVVYHAEDVIDFAWCAYPYFEVIEDQWEHVYIKLMVPPEHKHHCDRLIGAVKHSLSYLTENVGPYPYTSITILDPPLLGLKAGFMEYPTYITGGSFAIFPKGIRTLESLIAHEFAHQYYMGMIATNEKEEPWMDEGFVTYQEDKIMEAWKGCDGSLFNIAGYKVNNSAFSRHEYVSLKNPSCGAIARSGWEIKEGFKGITYSKTATMLKTLEGMLGESTFIELMKEHYNRHAFKHPRGEDFVALVKEFIAKLDDPNVIGSVDDFFDQVVYGTGVLDYSVGSISHFKTVKGRGLYGQGNNKTFSEGDVQDIQKSMVFLHRKGDVILPVDVRYTFEDGEVRDVKWSGEENSKQVVLESPSKLVSVEIDPDQKLYLDINLNNNSLTLKPSKTPAIKMASKVMYWVHNFIQTAGILI